MRSRSVSGPINYTALTISPPRSYRLGPGDILEIIVPDLYDGAEGRPLRVQVLDNGEIHLPMVGAIPIEGLALSEAQDSIQVAYAEGFLERPRVGVVLAERATVNVVVLGDVQEPGVVALPKYQNDVGHALAMAGGLGELAAEAVEVHRHGRGCPELPALDIPTSTLESQRQYETQAQFETEAEYETQPRNETQQESESSSIHEIQSQFPGFGHTCGCEPVLRIPLRGFEPSLLSESEIMLRDGDVVRVPRKTDDVFYVVGRLSRSNFVRFTIGERERELGAGFIIPRDRDIDVLTAVTMAGYIDPIESPTTVSVHRVLPDGRPIVILVDLIKARYDRRETIYVQPGDMIYLNPDGPWWFRITFDRVVTSFISQTWGRWVFTSF
jgi:protein involved in polysaccharide export with SLBB domain